MIREFIEQLDKLPQKAFSNIVMADADKPIIGIVAADSELSVADGALYEIIAAVTNGIATAGGVAKVLHVPSIDTTALKCTAAAKYDLPSRDIVANSVELLCASDYFDSLVFVASEQNVVFGMLLAAIRLNIPCVFVCQGTMSPVRYGKANNGYAFYYEQIAKIKFGKTPYELASEIRANLPVATGTDCDRYGANSVNCLLEATGMAQKGNGTAPAHSVERLQISRKTGMAAVKSAEDKCTPRRILTRAMLTNLVALDLACGGSSTTMLNLCAVATELGVRNVNFKTIAEMAKSTPVLLTKEDVKDCLMPQFHRAGGVYAMLKQLVDDKVIDSSVIVGENVTLAQLMDGTVVRNNRVIRETAEAVNDSALLKVVKGNLAEDGAFVHYKPDKTTFVGKAKVYNNEEMAVEAVLHKEIKPGDVVVIRSEGPKSCPGMREIYTTLALINAIGLADKVAVITDGRIADIYNGIAVGHITPEFGNQTAFSVLRDGDNIEINIEKARIACDINSKELLLRLRAADLTSANFGGRYLKKWSSECSSSLDGCVNKK